MGGYAQRPGIEVEAHPLHHTAVERRLRVRRQRDVHPTPCPARCRSRAARGSATPAPGRGSPNTRTSSAARIPGSTFSSSASYTLPPSGTPRALAVSRLSRTSRSCRGAHAGKSSASRASRQRCMASVLTAAVSRTASMGSRVARSKSRRRFAGWRRRLRPPSPPRGPRGRRSARPRARKCAARAAPSTGSPPVRSAAGSAHLCFETQLRSARFGSRCVTYRCPARGWRDG